MEAWIIDQLKKKERDRQKEQRPALQIPVPPPEVRRPQGEQANEVERDWSKWY